jgi:hypothetical protein
MVLAKPLCCRFIISQWRLPAVVLARGPTRRRLVRCPALLQQLPRIGQVHVPAGCRDCVPGPVPRCVERPRPAVWFRRLRFSHSKRGYLRQGRPYHCGRAAAIQHVGPCRAPISEPWILTSQLGFHSYRLTRASAATRVQRTHFQGRWAVFWPGNMEPPPRVALAA